MSDGRERADEVVKAFSAALGLGEQGPDETGRFGVQLKGIDIALQYADEPFEALWWIADIAPLGDADEAPAFVLKAGLLSWLANTMTLALGEDEITVVGQNCLPIELLNIDSLALHLERFVQAALELRNLLQKGDLTALDVPFAA